MKFNPLRFIFFLSSIIFLGSCLSTNTPTVYSADPAFVSLTFAVNDSVPNLNTAVFTLVDTTIINVDSLPFRTRVDSVVNPTFTFVSTAGTILRFPTGYKYKKTTAVLSGKDTIDFRQPISLTNVAADGKAYKNYAVVVNVHKVDPELYLWKPVTPNLYPSNISSQKTVILNDVLFYYLNDGSGSYLYTSTNGSTWNQSSLLKGLPVNTPLNDMINFNGKLYLTQDGVNIYSSTDGLNWTKNAVTKFIFKSLAFVLNGQLWAVVQSNTDSNYWLYESSDGIVWNQPANSKPIEANFPVNDFASVSYSSSTGKAKVLVSGGYSATDNVNALKNSWSTEDGVYWVDFSNENHTLDTLSVGASLISYDNKLFVFGTRKDNGGNFYKVSKDEGLSWQRPDTLRNFLPKEFTPRNYQSVVVLKPFTFKGVQTIDKKEQILESNRIFIIGGKSATTSYSDVWTGKLNRKNFLRQ